MPTPVVVPGGRKEEPPLQILFALRAPGRQLLHTGSSGETTAPPQSLAVREAAA